MPHQPLLNDDALLDGLLGVFRRYGYEGASLTRISAATGLKRSSLYYRFPGGKPEMVGAVLARANAWFAEVSEVFEQGERGVLETVTGEALH